MMELLMEWAILCGVIYIAIMLTILMLALDPFKKDQK